VALLAMLIAAPSLGTARPAHAQRATCLYGFAWEEWWHDGYCEFRPSRTVTISDGLERQQQLSMRLVDRRPSKRPGLLHQRQESRSAVPLQRLAVGVGAGAALVATQPNACSRYGVQVPNYSSPR